MSERKRVNISVDPRTYDRLRHLQHTHGFRNVCELMVAFAHILVDRLEERRNRQFDLPADDAAYIDEMFDELGHVEPTPDGTVPRRHNHRSI